MRHLLKPATIVVLAILSTAATLPAQITRQRVVLRPPNAFPARGGVGIGTQSPSTALHLTWGDILLARTGSPKLILQSLGSSGRSFSFRATDSNDARGCCRLVLRNETTGRDALELDSNGKVTLGMSASAPTRYYFDAAAMEVRAAANPTASSGIRYVARFSNSGGSGSGVIIQAGYEASTPRPIEVLRLASFSGPAKFIFFNDGRSYDLSDGRLKTNIAPIDHALDRLEGVRGVTFDWTDGNSGQVGLIAQEVEAAFPELVTETDGLKGIDYSRFTAVLVQAMKELRGEVELLRADNEALRRDLVELRNR